jgi:hypothetical protein
MKKVFATTAAALILMLIIILPQGITSTATATQSYSLGDFWNYKTTSHFFRKDSNSTMVMNVVGRETIDIDNMSVDVTIATIYSSDNWEWIGQKGQFSGSWYMSGSIYFSETPIRPVKSEFNYWMSSTSIYENQTKNFTLLSNFESLELPIVNDWDIPLDIGDIVSSECLISSDWSYSSIRNGNCSEKYGNRTYGKDINYTCLREEVVDVPAGIFDTFVINETKRRGYSLYWYSPTVGSYVQKIDYNKSGNETERIELLSYSYSGHVIFSFIEQYWHICLALVLTFATFIALHVVSTRYQKKEREPPSQL